MTYRKNQLKSFSNQKLAEITKSETDGETLLLIKQILAERNGLLQDKKQQLKKEQARVRKQTQKVVRHLIQAVRDRIQKKQKVTLDRSSRPTQEDIKDLTELYKYFENQNSLIDRNNQSLDQLLNDKTNKLIRLSTINKQISHRDFDELDKKYADLQQRCSQQQEKLSAKKQQLEKFQKHIETINETIENNRLKYDEIEEIVRKREVELDHLCTYYKNRCQEDTQTLLRQSKVTQILENELIKGQAILNFSQEKINELKISQFQSDSPLNH